MLLEEARDLALGLALRMADGRSQPVSERQALVCDNRETRRCAPWLRRAEEGAGHPDAVGFHYQSFRVRTLADIERWAAASSQSS